MKRQILCLALILMVAILVCSKSPDKDNALKSPGYIGLDPLPVKEVKFYSESLQREMYINVVLPRDYENSQKRYPVLYLCHGLTSNYEVFYNETS